MDCHGDSPYANGSGFVVTSAPPVCYSGDTSGQRGPGSRMMEAMDDNPSCPGSCLAFFCS